MAVAQISDFIPELGNLTFSPPTTRPVGLGGQNWTHCCLRALNDSLAIDENGNLTLSSTPYLGPDVTVEDLLIAEANGQLPCGATYNGDNSGSPIIQVPFDWCVDQCPGWQISQVSDTNQWVGPLVQFILPSLAFCLNIPRSRKLAIPHTVFRAHPRDLMGFASYWIRLTLALILVLIDTMVWLSVCFAFSGPMLLSAVYEYALDRKVLEYMAPPTGEPPKLPKKLKAQLLMSILVGNVRLASVSTQSLSRSGTATDMEKSRQTSGLQPFAFPRPPRNSVWRRVMAVVDEYETEDNIEQGRVPLSTKLKSLLNAQASFGSTIGAPIIFFVGSFIYTVIDNQNDLGDNDTSHALAFGMWWMTIPIVAVISCAMLASNSPSALQGIAYDGFAHVGPGGLETTSTFFNQLMNRSGLMKLQERIREKTGGYELLEYAYEGRFKTVTLWKRGPNKHRWVREAINQYEADHLSPTPTYEAGHYVTPDVLRKQLGLGFGDGFNVLAGAVLLILLPSVFAFLTSYNTPRKGLACRSLTYLVYAISQVCEMIIWSFQVYLKRHYGAAWSHKRTMAKAICWWGQAFVGCFGVFAAVGGTMMQVLGVYRSCACQVPAQYWMQSWSPDAYIPLSSNTADAIQAAMQWWTPTGSAAMGILTIITSLAWWHQRRLRKVFRDVADILDDAGRDYGASLAHELPRDSVTATLMSAPSSSDAAEPKTVVDLEEKRA